MRRILILILLLAAYLSAPATHNRAGEITYRHLENFKYELTITTYTYTLSPADRRELEGITDMLQLIFSLEQAHMKFLYRIQTVILE
jgi:hypothetical protein